MKKSNINKKLIGAIVVIFVIIIIVFILTNLKPYPGLSIKDINEKPEDYNNKTVTIQAWYRPSHGSNDEIYQKSYFSDDTEYLPVLINDDVDTSMLLGFREYLWTGIIIYEPWKSEYKYENVTYTRYGNWTYLNVTKIDTLYKEDGRHNTSKFIGSWKQIEEDNKSYSGNATWIFYKNNSFVGIYKDSTGVLYSAEWDFYMVDGETVYYSDRFFVDDGKYSPADYAHYYFSENNTKLTIDESDHRNLIRVFQKIDDTSRFIGKWTGGISNATGEWNMTFFTNNSLLTSIYVGEGSGISVYWGEYVIVDEQICLQIYPNSEPVCLNYEFSDNDTFLETSGGFHFLLNKIS